MSKLDDVRAAFADLIGTSGADIQNTYGMDGDWCMMTVWTGFRNAGCLDLLVGGEKTAWVPTCWDYYNTRGMTGTTPQAGALVIYDYNGNGCGDHIEYVTSIEDDGTFNCVSGNSGRDYVFAENVNMYGVLGFCYPDYEEENEFNLNMEDNDMTCIIRPNKESVLCYFDGTTLRALSHPDQVGALNQAYQIANDGKDIPIGEVGSPEAPWASRLYEAITGPEWKPQ